MVAKCNEKELIRSVKEYHFQCRNRVSENTDPLLREHPRRLPPSRRNEDTLTPVLYFGIERPIRKGNNLLYFVFIEEG